MTTVLDVRNLAIEFDGFRALDGVNFTVDEGELRFLIGPNGAGKTTLIDCVTGLSKPTEGEVHFAGVEISKLSEHRRVKLGVGRTFQTPSVFDSLSVLDNLDLAASFRQRLVRLFRPRRGISDGVATVIEQTGLGDKVHTTAGALSHGQKKWLEIGMLLVQGPSLLLLDEPVAGMSPEERLETGELLSSLTGERTVVVIEHDMAFLRRFAHTVTVLHEGRVITEGTVEQVQINPVVREVYLGRTRNEDPAEAAAR